MTYRPAKSNVMLFFSMMLDNYKVKLPGLKQGRLAMVDSEGVIGRWVFTSSHDGKQNVRDWNRRGGVIPPNYDMMGDNAWEFHTERIIRTGHTVNDGFLITYQGETSYRTKSGFLRSELMVHDDTNRETAPGSFGCLVALSSSEWDDFCNAVKESLIGIDVVPLYVVYTF